jgi:hypothetical protein
MPRYLAHGGDERIAPKQFLGRLSESLDEIVAEHRELHVARCGAVGLQ